MARPSSFKPEYAEQAYKLCLLGATDADLADFFEVSEQTINAWKSKQPEFLESLKRGKSEADANVADRLFQRAMGYTHPEEKIFQNNGQIVRAETTKHYAPDPTAAIFWLKNRRPDLWRDKIEHAGQIEHNYVMRSPEPFQTADEWAQQNNRTLQ